MGSEWGESPLADVAEIIDSRHKTPVYSDDGYPMVRVVDVNGGALSLKETKKVSEEVYEDFARGRDPEVGDLVITRVGSYGVVSYVTSNEKFCLGQNTAFIIPKINSRFLYYQLISPHIKWQIEQFVVGAVQKTISLKSIRQFKIKIPPVNEQKAIAHILGSLDDKIELNRQINETLEQMAQALFKSWFVDFDPVIDNALAAGNPIPDAFAKRTEQRKAQISARKPAKESENSHQSLFPSEFEFTEEMGWTPKGWEVLPISEVTEFREGPGVLAKDFHGNGVPLIRLAGLKNGVSLLDGCNYLDPVKVEKKWAHFRLEEGDILLSSSASLGRVAEVQADAIGAIPYTGIIGFRPKENKSVRRYIRHYLISSHFQMQVSAMGVGSVLNHFGPTHIKKMIMPVPSLLVQTEFSDMVTPFDTEVAQRLSESNTISKLRDTLLPKLLSGKLRIPDADKLIKEAVV